jgi:Bacteriophage minor capsid protein
MSVISDVATYLEDNAIGTIATDLFYSYYPDTDSAIVAVLDTGGSQPDPDIPTFEPTFQIIIRSTDYARGKAKAMAIRALLHRKYGELVTNQTYFYFILALQEPTHIGRNKNGLDEFSMNFRCRTR